MSVLHEMAEAVLLQQAKRTVTEHGCLVAERNVGPNLYIELSTVSPPCAGHSKPLDPSWRPALTLAPDFLTESGRIWPWRP